MGDDRPGVERRGAPPTELFLSHDELMSLVGSYAERLAAGDLGAPDFDPDDRWHRRVFRDRRVDVWLINWLPSQGTQLHDHGGSSGAFRIVSGTLSEAVVTGGCDLHDFERAAGSSASFGAHYVHDVRNLSDFPAVSVHAYSPPLTTMTYYDVDETGRALPVASLAAVDPEPQFEFEADRLAS